MLKLDQQRPEGAPGGLGMEVQAVPSPGLISPAQAGNGAQGVYIINME